MELRAELHTVTKQRLQLTDLSLETFLKTMFLELILVRAGGANSFLNQKGQRSVKTCELFLFYAHFVCLEDHFRKFRQFFSILLM